jgi:hypothetical protein
MKYHWIGHCKEGTSDKVWGLIRLTDHNRYNDYVAFWGRRGRALQTKIHSDIDAWDADKLCNKKEDKGYAVINPARLDQVYPEFEEDLQKTAVWAMLKV